MTLFYLILLVLPLVWLIKLFIYDTYKDSKNSQLYRLRTQVSFEAMKGNIEETDEDYRLLMYLINSEILLEKEGHGIFPITQFVECVIAPTVEGDESANRFKHLCENEKLAPYTKQVYEIILNHMERRLTVLKISVLITYAFSCVAEFLFKHTNKQSRNYKNNKIHEYDTIKSQYSEYFKINYS